MTAIGRKLQGLERRIVALESKLAAQNDSMAAFVAPEKDTIRISRAVAEEYLNEAYYNDDKHKRFNDELRRALSEQKGGSK